MKKYLYLIVSFVALTIYQSKGQEAGAYSQYMVQPTLINPALNGFDGGHHVLLNYKRLWAGFEGTPSLVTFNYQGTIDDNSGFGAYIFNERVASSNRFRGSLAYSFKIDAGDWKMGLGLSADYSQERLLSSVISDQLTDPNDPLIDAASEGISFFDASFGFYGRFKESFFIGFSAPHLVRARLTDVDGTDGADGTGFQSFTATVGNRFHLEEYGVRLEPSAMVRKMFNGPLILDGNLLAVFLDDQLYGGLTYRYTVDTGSGVGVLIGARVGNMSVFYSYDAGFGTFQAFNTGGHEVSLAFALTPRGEKVNRPMF